MPNEIHRFPKDGGRTNKLIRIPISLLDQINGVVDNKFNDYQNAAEFIFDACAERLKSVPTPTDMNPVLVAAKLGEIERHELYIKQQSELDAKCWDFLTKQNYDEAIKILPLLNPEQQERVHRALPK